MSRLHHHQPSSSETHVPVKQPDSARSYPNSTDTPQKPPENQWSQLPTRPRGQRLSSTTTIIMSYPTRSIPSLRQPSMAPPSSSTGQSPALVARVNEKKAELENLKELRDLSAAVASQMEALEQKLATLGDGTEAIALVMGNWHNVLRAINMASSKLPKPQPDAEATGALPQTLVRIPTEHAPALQAHTDAAEEG